MYQSIRRAFCEGFRAHFANARRRIASATPRLCVSRGMTFPFRSTVVAGVISSAICTASLCDGSTRDLSTILYPETPMIDSGFIKVDNIHTIHYHVYGNPKGKPVLFVHGGPGGGTDSSVHDGMLTFCLNSLSIDGTIL